MDHHDFDIPEENDSSENQQKLPENDIEQATEKRLETEEASTIEPSAITEGSIAETSLEELAEDEMPVEKKPEEEPLQTAAASKVSPYADSPDVMKVPVVEPKKPKKTRKAKRGSFFKTALCVILIVALVGSACAATAVVINGQWEDKFENLHEAFDEKLKNLENQMEVSLEKGLASISSGVSVSGTQNLSVNGGLTPAQVYAKNVRAVVMIYNRITNGNGQVGTATGSGFILTQDGYVVTNYHVIEGNGLISVLTSYGEQYPAKLVGYDQTNDVALLKVEATGLQPVTIGRSSNLIVGDQVVAIGNPLGELTSTLTVGYVSAMERDVTTEGFAINMIQTDAAINSGNSGGPLFNMKGEVIGITTAKYSGTSSSGASIEGVGFAIPSDDVIGILEDLMTHGYITGAYLGVSVSDMNAEAANYYGLPMGAYVQAVEQGYAAQRAGVQAKDIIVKIGDYDVDNVNGLTRALRNFTAGDETVIVVYRGGKEMKLPIVLDAKPAA